MKVTASPTEEKFDAPINGVFVPTRIWIGKTEGGVEIELYVLSIVPKNDADSEKLKEEIPSFMKPSRETFTINLEEDPAARRARILHETGMEE